MTAGQDYYKLLGVSRGASQEEIKKAYKKMALKWHPDRCKNESQKEEYSQKFAAVSKAYECLSDEEKKKIYDMYGEEGLQGGHPGGQPGGQPGGTYFNTSGRSPEDIFAEMFGGKGSKFSFSGGIPQGNGRQRRGPSQQQHFSGFGMNDMGGFGMNDMGGDGHMGGGGFEHFFPFSNGGAPKAARQPPKPVTLKRKLPVTLEDLYHGFQKKLKITKKVQNETTMQIEEKADVVTINGKPGWKPGVKITFPSAGDVLIGQPPQDICFEIEQKMHPRFKRNGDDLETTVDVTLSEALCGFEKRVSGIDGKALSMDMPMVRPATTKIFIGEGMPKKQGGRGNLVVKFNIVFPKTSLTNSQKTELRKVLQGIA